MRPSDLSEEDYLTGVQSKLRKGYIMKETVEEMELDARVNSSVVEKAIEANIGVETDNLTGDAAPKTAVTFTKEEESAARFLYLLPYIKKFGSAIGAKGMVRVMHALAEFPVGDSLPKFKNKQEEQLFNVFQELTAAKAIVVRYAMDQQKQALAATADQVNEGEANGNGN
jgi:hypothetical protein